MTRSWEFPDLWYGDDLPLRVMEAVERVGEAAQEATSDQGSDCETASEIWAARLGAQGISEARLVQGSFASLPHCSTPPRGSSWPWKGSSLMMTYTWKPKTIFQRPKLFC